MTIWPTISRTQASWNVPGDLWDKSCMQSQTVCRLTILWITSTTKPAPLSNFNIEESYPGHTSILPTTFSYWVSYLHFGLLWHRTNIVVYIILEILTSIIYPNNGNDHMHEHWRIQESILEGPHPFASLPYLSPLPSFSLLPSP